MVLIHPLRNDRPWYLQRMSNYRRPHITLDQEHQQPLRTHSYVLDNTAGDGSLIYAFGAWNEFNWSASINPCGFPGTGCKASLVSRRETRRSGSGVLLRVPSVE